MNEDNQLMIVDREELNLLKNKLNDYLYELSSSFTSLYTLYEDMVESGWDDDNQKQFERDLKEVEMIIHEDIMVFKEVSTNFLEKKIKIIDAYLQL